MHDVRMPGWQAALGSAIFVAVAPGVVAGLVPWWLTRWDARSPMPWGRPVQALGVSLACAGVLVLGSAFLRFVLEGIGTSATPMYLAVWAASSASQTWPGEALMSTSAVATCPVMLGFVPTPG